MGFTRQKWVAKFLAALVKIFAFGFGVAKFSHLDLAGAKFLHVTLVGAKFSHVDFFWCEIFACDFGWCEIFILLILFFGNCRLPLGLIFCQKQCTLRIKQFVCSFGRMFFLSLVSRFFLNFMLPYK